MNINSESDKDELYAFLGENQNAKVVGVDDIDDINAGHFSIFSEDEPEVYCSHETKRLIDACWEIREVAKINEGRRNHEQFIKD